MIHLLLVSNTAAGICNIPAMYVHTEEEGIMCMDKVTILLLYGISWVLFVVGLVVKLDIHFVINFVCASKLNQYWNLSTIIYRFNHSISFC